MISTKDTAEQAVDGRHGTPPAFEDYPDEQRFNVHRIYARVTGGMMLPLPAVPGAHREEASSGATRVPAIELIAHGAFDLGARLYKLGAHTSFARVDREPCRHCEMRGHFTTVRFHPNPDPECRFPLIDVPDACACCAEVLLVQLLDEAAGREVAVEVWHPKAVA